VPSESPSPPSPSSGPPSSSPPPPASQPQPSPSPPSRPKRGRARRVALVLVAGIVLALLSLVRTDIPQAELLPRYGGGASRFATVDGVTVHYRDEGAGPPLVLVHGTSSSLHTWDGWAERLAPHRRVVRLDLPGFGLTGPAPDHDYGASRYARVVFALMKQLGIDRADVGGNSLGGRVALTMALEHPERVRSLLLVDAAGLSGLKPPPVFAIARVPVLGHGLRWLTPRAMIRRSVEDVYGDPSRVTDALVDRYYELTRRDGNREALYDRLNGPADPPLDDRLGEVRVPVLVLWGERDAWIPLPYAHRFAEGLHAAKLVTYADAGHVPMEELPEPTARDAEAFLETLRDEVTATPR
jgi:pimeloyl-ACP methyl ester carboxylesterase